MSWKGLLYLVDTDDDLCLCCPIISYYYCTYIYIHHFQDLSHPNNQIEKNQMLFLGL